MSNVSLNVSPLENKQRRLQKERLMSQFTDVLQQFQVLQKQAAQKETEYVAKVRSTFLSRNTSLASSFAAPKSTFLSRNTSTASSFATPKSYGTVNQVQLELVEVKELKERENAVRQIEKDMGDLVQIFTDLGIRVQEQGDVVDRAGDQMEDAAVNVQEGRQQLNDAVKYKSASRKKMIILMIILLIVLAVVMLIAFKDKIFRSSK